MSLQARASEWDHRLYNVNRDVAHNFGDVVREVAARLEDGRWPILVEVCERYGVTQDDLGKACEAYCLFVASATETKKERMGACLTRSGWYAVPEVAQVALMAILGTVMSGYYWVGAREATVGGQGPCLTYQDLRDAGKDCARLMMIPRWKRRCFRIRAWAMNIVDAIFGRTTKARNSNDVLPQPKAVPLPRTDAVPPSSPAAG